MTLEIKQSLIIDDDEDYRNLIARKLSRSFPGIIVNEIDPLSDALPDESYCWDNIDFILLDYHLGLEITGLDWFKQFKPGVLPATILLTAKGSEELAVRTIKLGIDDYIVKEHFDNERLTDSIRECVTNKRLARTRFETLIKQTDVFNKSNFIQRLRLITDTKSTINHLFLINPESYQQIGKQKGINHQDGYIKFVSEIIHDYLNSKNISHNIFIYREEYIAVILEVKSFKKHLNDIFKLLHNKSYIIGNINYSCSIHVGVISPQTFETKELDKSDFELLSIALVLCNSVKTDSKKKFCNYGDINIKDPDSLVGSQSFSEVLQTFNFEDAIKDGRVLANYQPWIYVQSDVNKNIKNIYDVRIEFIDTKGNTISHNILIKLLDNPYAKRIVDRWTLRSTASLLKEFSNSNDKNNIKQAVKITLSSFTDPSFISWLRTLLTEADLPNDCLLIEADADQIIRSPDDFKLLVNTVGTEFKLKFILSGIFEINTYYKLQDRHIFDYVKLNIHLLTHGLPRGPLRKLVNDIKNEGSEIIAVYISDAQMLMMANEFDVDYMHGYLIGRPNIDVISGSDGDLYCVM
ncbi:MAG: hybrid sensor histidine kinase/response regulator [Gammaproteobacteria bacterium]|nr:hybrid sensor histidine kinase/response regulator [Gammaproteobacteria bacterium]